MSSNRRERAYAKRRYSKWQAKQEQRHAHRRRNRRLTRIALATLAVVAITTTIGFLLAGNDDRTGTTAASPTDTPTPSVSTPSATGSATSSMPAAGTCPAPTVTPPAQPQIFASPAAKSLGADRTWALTLTTTCGPIGLSLDGAKAPQATSVMLQLARAGYFDGTPCHRLTTEAIYVLQCGDPTGTGTGDPGFSYGPVENAPANNVYPAGTVAMARRGGDGASMGSQFFLVYEDSTIPSDAAGGYTVLGTIDTGLDVLKKVADGGVTGDSTDGAPRLAVSIAGTTVKQEA